VCRTMGRARCRGSASARLAGLMIPTASCALVLVYSILIENSKLQLPFVRLDALTATAQCRSRAIASLVCPSSQ
jgi:hypothetical protein